VWNWGVMLTQEEQKALITTLSTRKFSPSFFKALKATLEKKKQSAVPTRTRCTTASQQTSQSGKRKATELSSHTLEPAIRRPATGAVRLRKSPGPRTPQANKLPPAAGNSCPPRVERHATVAVAPISPHLPSWPLKSLAKGSDTSELAVS
jgi:hypothetical protein